MKKTFLPFLFFALSFIIQAQNQTKDWYLIDNVNYKTLSADDKLALDSILPRYHKATNDTLKLAYLNELIEAVASENLWPKYNQLMLKLSENKPERVYIKYYAAALNNIGFLANSKGNISLAINSYNASLQLREEIKDMHGLSESLHNLGSFYLGRGNSSKALEYLLKALDAKKAVNDKANISVTLDQIGGIYLEQKKFNEALDYLEKSVKIAQQTKNKKLISGSYSKLGDAYTKLGDTKKAITCYTTAITDAGEVGDKDRLATAYTGLSNLYFKENNYTQAKKYALLSNQIGVKLGFPRIIKSASELLYKIYKDEHKTEEALQMYEKYIQMRDSINNNEQTKMLTSIEYDAKEAQLEVEHEKQAVIAAAESKRQKLILYSVIGVLILVFILVLIVYKGYRQKKKAHHLISRQKEEVVQSRKELIDSINYAKLIQQAIFKEEEHISEHLPPHFVFFKPKNIVSGDFHWALEKGDYLYITAADCTGHGVPGAFLTMLGISFLNEINAKEIIFTPAEILNQLRDKLVKELGRQGQTKDGMDISMIRLNLQSKELIWAGAYNPLWYISNNALHEIKADKQPIGYTEKPVPFTDHLLNVTTSDTLYLFTDGYADQFGGPNGKKFKYKQLSELLLANCHLSMDEQKDILSKQFDAWKGRLEQVDDVTLIGIKI